MSRETARERLAAAYNAFRQSLGGIARADAPTALEAEGQWSRGLFPLAGQTLHHGAVRIADAGEWNRGEGPDFRRAEIELNGQRLRGDIELDVNAADWERHAEDERYNGVVLHVVLNPPAPAWFTRTAAHTEVPVFCPAAPPQERREPATERAISFGGDSARLLSLVRAAAACRLEDKQRRFRMAEARSGSAQAWFEAWAETLGYSANKLTMQLLAHRAPLKDLGNAAEAVLFGTAGFLVPVLPERCTPEARAYHRRLWDAWWPLQDRFQLSGERALPWVLSPVRPMNHPQRRVAALAASALRWQEVLPHLNIAATARLRSVLTSLTHPYWDTHCTLPSAAQPRRSALVGRQRADDFLLNHVYAADSGESAWQSYLALRTRETPARVAAVAEQLMPDLPPEARAEHLHRCYIQQGLLQLAADFRSTDGLFPQALAEWQE